MLWSSVMKALRAVLVCRESSIYICNSRNGNGIKRSSLLLTVSFAALPGGASIGHVCPEAAVGGPIALVEEGDIISINIPENRLDVKVSEEEMESRRAKWQPRQPQVTTGYLDRYRKMVTSANRGAILEIK